MLTSDNRKQMMALVAISGLSLVSVFLLLYGLLCGLLSRKQTLRPIGFFFLLLLFWELMQAISWFMSLKWIIFSDLVPGPYCYAQAILKQLNATGVSLATIGLSWCILHNYVFQAKDLQMKRALIAFVLMSILQILILLIPTVVVGIGNLYQPSGVWCWIPKHPYLGLKLATTYIFYWTSAGFSLLTALAYCASAYVDKRLPSGHFWIGFLTRRNGLLRMGFFSELVTHEREPMFGFTFDVLWFGRNKSIFFIQYLGPPPEELMPSAPSPSPDTKPKLATSLHEEHNRTRTPMRDAVMMLSFPITFTVLVLPLSVVRNMEFTGYDLGPTADIIVGSLFALTGLLEVLLFILLKPDFGLRLPKILECIGCPVDESSLPRDFPE